jgi:hypothetical protein
MSSIDQHVIIGPTPFAAFVRHARETQGRSARRLFQIMIGKGGKGFIFDEDLPVTVTSWKPSRGFVVVSTNDKRVEFP